MLTSIEVDTTSEETRVGHFFSGTYVDLVCEDIVDEPFCDGEVESDHQLAEGLLVAAHKYGQGVGSVRCGGDATDWRAGAGGDLTVVD